jgi:uncharacterized protein (TIGR03435 family)
MNLPRYWCALVLLALSMRAQQPKTVEFEVAAIKPNLQGGKRSGIDNTQGFWKADNVTVRFLITYAYQVLPDQISGAPAWLDADRYDIEARYEQDAALSGKQDAEQTRMRLQALLASRFQFEMHRQSKEWQAYVLVAGKKGAKLTPTERKEGSSMHSNNGHLEAQGVSMEDFARGLAARLTRPVINETGLEGRFDFKLDYDPEVAARMGEKENPSPGADVQSPSLFTALQDQLGLKLESKKVPVEFLVIERVERPSGN